MNKEIEDALHMLLHCSLKDTEYETQFEQYKIVRNYITDLQQENKQLREQNKEKKKRNIKILRRFEECIKLLNELDFDKYAYGKSSLEKIKNDLLDILILGDDIKDENK